jgi:hypothetical protein
MDNKPADIWTSCLDCGQRVTGDSIHTCSPQIKELSDEEIIEIGNAVVNLIDSNEGWIEFAKAILKKASEK